MDPYDFLVQIGVLCLHCREFFHHDWQGCVPYHIDLHANHISLNLLGKSNISQLTR